MKTSVGPACLLALVWSGQALAQPELQDPTDAAAVGVRERVHPEWAPVGVQIGPALLHASLELDSTYDDNARVTEADPIQDLLWTLTPRVSVQGDQGRNSFNAEVVGGLVRATQHSELNTDNVDLQLSDHFDMSRQHQLRFAYRFGHLSEPMSATNAPQHALSPVQYDLQSVSIGLQSSGSRLGFDLSSLWAVRHYQDVAAAPPFTDVVIDQSFRDDRTFSGTARLTAAVSSATRVFVAGSANYRRYPHFGARDSSGYDLDVGASFALSHLLRGQVGIGYLRQDYHDFGAVSGPTGDIQLEWLATALTTVTLNVERRVEDAVIFGAGGYLVTSADLRVDHELLRNLILGFDYRWSGLNYHKLDRDDQRREASVSADWLLNRRLAARLAFNRLTQSSSGLARGPRFSENRALLGLSLRH